MADLTGTHTYQLDPKGRMSLPARFRAVFSEGAYLTLGQEGCLYALPREEWERQKEEARANPASDPQARAYARFFFGNAEPVDLDNQGRLLVPQKLRGQVGIAREAVVRGVGSYMEIWERERFETYEQQFRPAYEAGALQAGDSGGERP
ncbi:MAG: division/cell wall cluster transcriptional repressor MraZ [Actinomycetota bacterium]